MSTDDFHQHALRLGFEGPRTIDYESGANPDFHTHDFDAMVMITAGELHLAFRDRVEKLTVGDTCTVPAGTEHSERTGDAPAASILYTRSPQQP